MRESPQRLKPEWIHRSAPTIQPAKKEGPPSSSPYRKYMEELIFWGSMACVAVTVFSVWMFFYSPPNYQIDCAIAEISPDFNAAQKQACRDMRLKQKTTGVSI